jgi:hypothetical protein
LNLSKSLKETSIENVAFFLLSISTSSKFTLKSSFLTVYLTPLTSFPQTNTLTSSTKSARSKLPEFSKKSQLTRTSAFPAVNFNLATS